MNTDFTMKIIARMQSQFPEKFGIPRQSGVIPSLKSTIVFEPEYRNSDALRGLEDFSHLWIIWEFSKAIKENWSPTVRPPRLGGNTRMGVFATRSPFRPNPIGLSCVKIDSIEKTEKFGTVIHVFGADLMDGTPIFDIKPYLPYADYIDGATGGFTVNNEYRKLTVTIPGDIKSLIPEIIIQPLIDVLENDPRPHYQNDPERIYGFTFDKYRIRFKVDNNTLYVISVEKQ